jgi:histidinol-phosphatase (PHP family)
MAHSPDYHTHSRFSCDSESTVEALCLAALERGMSEIAITDHADFEPLDPCSGYFKPEPYWEAIKDCREKFAGSLVIRAGVECGETHRYRRQIDRLLSAHKYDFVLGSLHWADDRPAWDRSFFDGLDLQQGLQVYFEELERLAAQGDYDVLGHFDFVRRAAFQRYGSTELDLVPHEQLLRRILRTVAERRKGLEVNTAAVRLGAGDPGPPTEVLRWFREEGGEIVTLGSDAHSPKDVGADFEQALAMVRQAGFEYLSTFELRSPRRVAIA